MQQRLEEINKVIKTQNYYEWRTSQAEKNEKSLSASDPLWYTALLDITANLS
jgi:hypothetical protein